MNDRGSLGTSARAGQSSCVKDFLRAMGISPVRAASTVLHPGGFKVMDGCYWTVDNPSSSVWPDPLSARQCKTQTKPESLDSKTAKGSAPQPPVPGPPAEHASLVAQQCLRSLFFEVDLQFLRDLSY